MEKIHNLLTPITGQDKIGFIDTSQPSLYIAAASIIFNPLYWNTLAYLEYHHKLLTRISPSPLLGCYALALSIFALGILRDSLYTSALSQQPLYPVLHQPLLGAILFAAGQTLVLSSMWALGVTGTYLGDYFGILMDEKVEGFPFNVTGAPMYWGSTMCFLGTSLWYGRGAGVVLSALVLGCYVVALRFEDPFTAMIYAKKDEDDARPKTRSMTKKDTPVKSRKKA